MNNILIVSGGQQGDSAIHIHVSTLLYLRQITNKDPLYSTGNSTQRYVAGWMGSLGEKASCVLNEGPATTSCTRHTRLRLSHVILTMVQEKKNEIWQWLLLRVPSLLDSIFKRFISSAKLAKSLATIRNSAKSKVSPFHSPLSHRAFYGDDAHGKEKVNSPSHPILSSLFISKKQL